jgi:hypothetical protein
MSQFTIKTNDIIKLQVSQVVDISEKNTTSNNRNVSVETTTVTSWDSQSSIQNIRETTKSHKFSAAVNASGTIFGVKSSSSVGYELEDLVKTYYKAEGSIKKFKSTTVTRKDSYTLSPGDTMTIYTNTLSGGGYEHTWDTFEKLTDGSPTFVTVTVEYDLAPIFDELMMTIITDAQGITTDAGEWGRYSEICQDAKIKGIRTYIDRVINEIWTSGLDQGSWTAIHNAARNAANQNDADALQIILLGFYNVRRPSHNTDAWASLIEIANKYLYNPT